MIEELSHWDVRDKRLKSLGRRIEEINKEFSLLAFSLENGLYSGIVNMSRQRGLSQKIENLRDRLARIEVTGRDRQAYFDRLVLKDFQESLFTQQEFIRFFFTWKYNEVYGVDNFFNYTFLPREKFQGREGENGAIAFLESIAKDIDYRKQTKRENLMNEMFTYPLGANPSELEDLLVEQIPRLRKIIGDYNVDMGFETREQVDAQNAIVEQKEIEKIRGKMRSLFGPYKGDITQTIMFGLDRQVSSLQRKAAPFVNAVNELVYDLVLNHESYCAWNSGTKVMEVCADRFYFYKDKKTGKLKLYAGDLIVSAGHENYHRLQTLFSRFMPAGLKGTPEDYNISGRTICEGVPNFLETNFLYWVEKNRQRYPWISKKDVKIAKSFGNEIIGNMVVRLLHSIYHRHESWLEGGKRKKSDVSFEREKEPHLRLAKVCRVPVYADHDYLGDESLPETYYFAFYLFGERYVQETISKLEEKEKKRHGGSIRSAKRFLRRNEPLILQGLLTGNWGWQTHKDFFIHHYWPKARKYCI